MKYYVKLIVGFRRDQEHTISAQEAHKAYYLFLHPDERGIFSNGLAIKGDQIQEIVPDYQTTMGWNKTHVLGDEDYNQLRAEGVSQKMQYLMSEAKRVANTGQQLNAPLSSLIEPYGKPQLREAGAKSMKQLLSNR